MSDVSLKNLKKFKDLAPESKVDFFVKCQSLLIQHHPDSKFIARQGDVKDKISFFKEFFHRYQGYVHSDDNICILYNHVFIKDRYDPVRIIKEHIYQPPRENYNAVSVDFVVFRKLDDCLEFCKSQYNEQTKYIVFVKNSEIKVYETAKLLEKAAHFNVNITS